MAQLPSDNISDLRRDYGQRSLDRDDLDSNPIEQFRLWFADAQQATPEANAMTLATATPDGLPSARIVLLKGLDDRGFVFYSNYASRKGVELAANPRAALVFYWPALERQVRIVGDVTRTSREESANYFHTRPRGAQLSACISRQSHPATREELQREWEALERTHEGHEIPLPADWGGYRLDPQEIEFWQGRASRLHDRFVYRRQANSWQIERLAP